MIIIYFISSVLFFYGIVTALNTALNLPDKRTKKALAGLIKKKEKEKVSEKLIKKISEKIEPFIKLTHSKRNAILSELTLAGSNKTPAQFVANNLSSAFIAAVITLPLIFINKFFLFVSLGIFAYQYLSLRGKPRKDMLKRKKKIEFELSFFVSRVLETLKYTKDIKTIIEKYVWSEKTILAEELRKVIAGTNTGSFEYHLMRMDTRISSGIVSEVIQGLLGIIKGDDMRTYFSMLSHDLKQFELSALKKEAMKRPPKIKRQSYIVLACFVTLLLMVLISEMIISMKEFI